MANVLENVNLDRIGYGVQTNWSSSADSILKLRLETVALLNFSNVDIKQQNKTITCASACGTCQHTKNDCIADSLKYGKI